MNSREVADKLAATAKQYVLYLSHSGGNATELTKAAPNVKFEDIIELSGSCIWLAFETYEGAYGVFKGIIGDDGPTATNSYNGKCRVYAYLSGPDGGITENT